LGLGGEEVAMRDMHDREVGAEEGKRGSMNCAG
jgi:hypothetical protein